MKKHLIFRYSKQQHGNWAHLKWEPNQTFPQNLSCCRPKPFFKRWKIHFVPCTQPDGHTYRSYIFPQSYALPLAPKPSSNRCPSDHYEYAFKWDLCCLASAVPNEPGIFNNPQIVGLSLISEYVWFARGQNTVWIGFFVIASSFNIVRLLYIFPLAGRGNDTLQSPLCFYSFVVLWKAVLSIRDSHNLMLYLYVT